MRGPEASRSLADFFALELTQTDASWSASIRRTVPPRRERPVRKPSRIAIVPSCAPSELEVERGTCRVSFSANVRFHGKRREVRFELRFQGDRIDGYWEYGAAEPAGRPAVAGILTGRRGSEAPKALTARTPLPCDLCCDVQFRCGGMGPRACNSSMTCLGDCDERLASDGPAATIAPCAEIFSTGEAE